MTPRIVLIMDTQANIHSRFGGRMIAGMTIGAGMLVLAAEPVSWLARTWTDPSYDSKGFWVFAAAAGLFLWSFTSRRVNGGFGGDRVAVLLLAACALVRLIGRVLAIQVIGALALVVDVYALGRLAGLGGRKRAVSPFWLAALFMFSLPLERIVQRTIGYGLQHVSAAAATAALGAFIDNVSGHGVRILIAGKDVLVDLPCSGARGALLMFMLMAGLMAVCRPAFRQAAIGFMITLLAAFIGNTLRIAVLAVGLAFPVGVNVMAQPWHDLIGVAALGISAAPIAWWAARIRRKPDSIFREPTTGTAPSPFPARKAAIAGAGFIVLAQVIVGLPQKLLDVSPVNNEIYLPRSIGGEIGEKLELLPKEKAYFTQFGGGAAKVRYGERTVLVVRTSAPLRHLHAPDECLRGLGFEVQYTGLSRNLFPTAVYRATGPDGRDWRVAVSFYSDRGQLAAGVSEAVWQWFKTPDAVWTEVQRISPWTDDALSISDWDLAVAAALDIPVPEKRKGLLSYLLADAGAAGDENELQNGKES